MTVVKNKDIRWGELYGSLRDVLSRDKSWKKLQTANHGYSVITELDKDEGYKVCLNKRHLLIKETIDPKKSTVFKIEFFSKMN